MEQKTLSSRFSELEVKTPQKDHECGHKAKDGESSFEIRPFTIVCSDFEHNQKTSSIWIDCPVVCGGTLALPMVPKSVRSFSRYLVDLEPDSEHGRWVNVVIDDILVRVFCSSFKQLEEYIQCLCSVCNCPRYQCTCGGPLQWTYTWVLYGENGLILDSKNFNRYTTRKNHLVFAEPEFPETQANKSYESILVDSEEYEPFVKLLEDCAALFYDMKKSTCLSDVAMAFGTFTRSVTGRSCVYIFKDLFNKLLGELRTFFKLQSNSHWVETMADVYENYSRCKNTLLAERLKKVFNHLIAHSLYHKLGIEVDPVLFDRFEEQKIRINLLSCFTFLDACASLTVFLLKQGRQCMVLGEIEPLFISADTSSEWLVTSKQILVKFESACNPAAIGSSIFEMLHTLAHCIKSGHAMMKYSSDNKYARSMILKIVLDLETCQNKYLVSTAAATARRTPFGVAIYGTPGTGKSSVLEMLYHYDCFIRGRDPDNSYRYIHPADSEFFDGFNSSMHTMVFDDVAQHRPSKIQGVDPTSGFFIRAINSIAWCPPQAALENKGTTPVLVETVFATTNTLDMNIPLYFEATLAVYRRFPFHVEPVVKEKFRKRNLDGIPTLMFDPTKNLDGQTYEDCWDYIIREPVQVSGNMGEFRVVANLSSTKELLKYYRKKCEEHHRNQDMMLSKFKRYEDVVMCEQCGYPSLYCECSVSENQAGRLSEGVVFEPLDVEIVRMDPTEHPTEPEPVGSYQDLVSEQDFEEDRYDRYAARYVNGQLVFPQIDFLADQQWRKKREVRMARVNNNHIIRDFLAATAGEEKLVVNAYVNSALNISLHLGYTDEEIVEDFKLFKAAAISEGDLVDLREYVDMISETTGRRLKIVSDTISDRIFRLFVSLYFYSKVFRETIHFFGRFGLVRRFMMPLVRPLITRTENQKYIARKLGQTIDKSCGELPKWANLLMAACAVITAIGSAFLLHRYFNSFEQVAEEIVSDEPEQVEIAKEEEEDENQFGIYPKPLREKEKKNPWVAPERTLTSLDFSSSRITEPTAFLRNLAYNVVRVSTTGNDGRPFVVFFHVLVISNDTFITNDHNLEGTGPYQLQLEFVGKGSACDKIKFTIQEEQILRYPKRDIAIVKTKALPARFKNIQNNFCRQSMRGHFEGFIFKKNSDNEAVKHMVLGMDTGFFDGVIGGRHFQYPCLTGDVLNPTVQGDSGSVWIAETGFGPVIVGLHSVKHTNTRLACTRVTLEDIQEWCLPMKSTVGVLEVVQPLIQNERSYIDYHNVRFMAYHGEMKGFRARPKHHVYETEIADQVFGKEICGIKVERRLVGPVMDNWRPQQVSLREFVEPVSNMNEVILEQCYETYIQYVLSILPKDELELLHPYPLEVAINGAPGLTFVDAIKKSTSMGYPWRTTKRKFCIPLEDLRFQDGVTFTPEIIERIEERMERLLKGIRIHPIFSASLKDEPVSMKKFKLCKTRVFFCCPADFLILVRMCFMGFCRVVQRNPFIFGVAIGLNPHSTDWNKIFVHLSKFGIHTTVAGDHVFYDKKMQLVLLKGVMHMVIRFYEIAGTLSKEELIMYYTIVEDMVNPSVDYFGMLITLMGGEVSGHQMTTLLNCLVSIVYIMYIYCVIYKTVSDFFEHVAIITLGDDHVFTVSEHRLLLTHTRVQEEMKKLGLDYTMAEKDAESVPFICLHDAPFLKRKFVYSPELQTIIGPIDVNTIFKMLTVNVRSRGCSKPEQLAQSICAAVAEAYFHGREFFEEFVAFVDNLKKSPRLEYEIKRYPYLDWKGYTERFHNASNSYVACQQGPSQNAASENSYCLNEPPVLQSLRRVDSPVVNLARAILEIRIYGRMELDSKEDSTALLDELICGPDNKRLASSQNLTGNYADNHIPDTAAESVDQQEQTTFFVNEPDSSTLDLSSPFDKVASHQKIPYELGEFLKRPTVIFQYRWTENDTPGLKFSFDPWFLYFAKPAIKNKLQGFNYLRANLVVKLLINGSPFYYGKLGAFYRPMARQMTNTVPTTVPVRLRQIAVSQRPHVWLDNQSTSNEEMVLPMVYPYPWVPLRREAELVNMGTIELWQYAALRSANGVTTAGIDVTGYAYCSDIELAGPTAQGVLQSKKEYTRDGQISGPASTVASVAGALKKVPMIGGMATATETAANMVADVASFFGFTNVPNVSDVQPFKNIPFQLASSTISEPAMKLSLQPKQEIAVGSSAMGGSDEDELLIHKLVSRESFLCGTLWTTSAIVDQTLFVTGVCPTLYDFDTTTRAVAHTPLSYWSVPFEYWRGDIIFRFKVVRSQYHRGRLNINWDVGADAVNEIPNFGDPSTMNVVLDLDESDEVEVEVPYVQAKLFLKCGLNGEPLPTGRVWENSNSVVALPPFEYNGVLSVKVMNRLTAPEATSDVDVLVFVRAGKNFHFAAPADILQGWTHSAVRTSVNQSNKVYTLGNGGEDDDVFRQVFGENIVSIRELLHRSTLSSITQVDCSTSATGPINMIVPLKRYPRPPGCYNNGWDQATIAASTQQYNFSRMTLLNWVLPVFIGYKGSVNITADVMDIVGNKFLDVIMMERNPIGDKTTSAQRKPDFWSNPNAGSSSARAKLYSNQLRWGRDGIAGAALTNARTNTGLCTNLPYYNNARFLITDPYVQYSNQDPISGGNEDWYNLRCASYAVNPNTNILVNYIYYATGPDFDVVFNLNCPVVFYFDDTPA